MPQTTTTTMELYDLLRGYSLTTAEILYRLPDHPALLDHWDHRPAADQASVSLR